MVIKVKVIVPGVPKPLTYSLEQELPEPVQGYRVVIPLRKKFQVGFIVSYDKSESSGYQVKAVKQVLDQKPFFEQSHWNFLEWLASYYLCPLANVLRASFHSSKKSLEPSPTQQKRYFKKSLWTMGQYDKALESKYTSNQVKEIWQQLMLREDWSYQKYRESYPYCVQKYWKEWEQAGVIQERGPSGSYTKQFNLNEQQQMISNRIWEDHEQFNCHLIHGVTGSGKTQIYFDLAARILQKNKNILVLFPEINIVREMEHRFKEHFSSRVIVLDSSRASKEREYNHHVLQEYEGYVILGARLSILAPQKSLGGIIIDEEHERVYKQEEIPTYHARDAAVMRAKMLNIPIILGSATPSYSSYYNAQVGKYKYYRLDQRYHNQNQIKKYIVDMNYDKINANLISKVLADRIQVCLKKKQQVILFLNKRGSAHQVFCTQCGHSYQCPSCDTSLKYYQAEQKLKCHYCEYQQASIEVCTECSSPQISYRVPGTEYMVQLLKKIYPQASIERLDKDNSSNKGYIQELIERMKKGTIDILVGTQMITKGWDFKNVTLVGILWAESSVSLWDYTSSERLSAILRQVAGRAGRWHQAGEVVVQSYTPKENTIQRFLLDQETEFYQEELILREQLQYPPFSRVIEVHYWGKREQEVKKKIHKAKRFLDQQKSLQQSPVLGPVPCSIVKIRNHYHYRIIMKLKKEINYQEIYQRFKKENPPSSQVKWYWDVDI